MSNNQEPVPAWAQLINKFSDEFLFEAPGRKCMEVYHIINAQKFTVIAYIFLLMWCYDNFSQGTWVYLALHGIYGYCWLTKDFGFRDQSLTVPASWNMFFRLHLMLLPYLFIPWLFVSNHVSPSGIELFFAVSMHTLGIAFMIGGDCQRHFTLKFQRGLINTGMFKYTRNPNYFGEILIYASYAYLADHWLATVIIIYQVVFLFLPRMYRKDHSISRHPGWAEYKAQSSLVVPWAIVNGRALKDLFSANHKTG